MIDGIGYAQRRYARMQAGDVPSLPFDTSHEASLLDASHFSLIG